MGAEGYALKSPCWALLLVIVLLWPCYPVRADDGLIPPGIHLQEFDTEHFRILYQDCLTHAVPYIAEQCEQALTRLSALMQWHPHAKIDVLFTDTLDTHNGWSMAIPHNTMALFACGSEQGSVIYQPGSYLKRTIYHELMHVLSMDMRYGYNRVLSQVFGKIYPITGDPLSLLMFYLTASPVALAPEWYLEGLAIWAENEFAAPGRGDSTLVDMIFRCAVFNNTLLDYSHWDPDLPYWPYGMGAYLYGMKAVQCATLSATAPADHTPGPLVQNLAHSWLFNFDAHPRKTTGMNFSVLERRFEEQENHVQRAKILKLNTLKPSAIPRITSREALIYQVRYMGNEVYFLRQAQETRDTLCVYSLERHRIQSLGVETTAEFGSLSPSPDGRYLYYTRMEKQRTGIYYSLRRFDMQRRQDSLATDNGRFRCIDIAPDGQRVALLSMRAGRCTLIEKHLAAIDDPTEGVTVASGGGQEDISPPRYAHSGENMVYARRDAGGSSLYVYDCKKDESRLVYHSMFNLLFPAWTPGDNGIIFSSDQNGVYNLYEIRLDVPSSVVPLTHVIGGVFNADCSPDGRQLAVVAYDNDGYYLSLIPYEPQAYMGKELPRIETADGDARPIQPQAIGGEESPPCWAMPLERYSSFSGMRFDNWSPWFTASTNGAVGGLEVVFSDPTGYQQLLVLGGMESRYGTKIGAIEYRYRGLPPALYLFANQTQMVYPHLIRTLDQDYEDYAERVRTFGMAVDMPLMQGLRHELDLQGGYRYADHEVIQESAEAYQGRTLTAIELGDEGETSVWSKMSFSNVTAFGRSNSFEDGRVLGLTAEKTFSQRGGHTSTCYLGLWNEYIVIPYLKNHVVKLSSCYGIGRGHQGVWGLLGVGGNDTPLTTFGLDRSIALRGYEENQQTGDHLAKITVAYRFPIWHLFEAETGSMPMYYRQLFAEVFYDGGMAWSPGIDGNDRLWLDSLGLEVNIALKLLRFLRIAPGIGFAYAPDHSRFHAGDDEEKRYQFYLTIKGFVNE